MTQAETMLDQQALMCISDSLTCDYCLVLDCEQPVHNADSTGVLIKYDSPELSSSFDGITPHDEMADAPIIVAGNTGHTLRSLLPGYVVHYLGLNQAQWSCLIMTYNADSKSSHAGILVRDIYNMLLSGSPTTITTQNVTIKVWNNNMFFLIDVGVPGMPALFTPSSQTRLMHADPPVDATKLLVPVIPNSTKVRLSTRYMSSTPFDDSVPSWPQAFLRQDILWIIHYRPTPHTGKVDTIKLAMR